MGAYIVTGLKGQEHVTSADDGAFNAGIVGTGKYVMKTAEQFAAEIVSNNIVRIKSGDLVNQGRHIRIEVNDYEDMTIENGAQSVKRNDLIVMRYKKDTSTTIELESAELVVIKGTAGATATDPTYTSGDILAGATQDDFPLYRVSLNGLNIEKVTPLFSTVPNLNELNTNLNNIGVRWYSFTDKLYVPAGQYVSFSHDCSAIAKTGYTLVPINLGFDPSSSGDSACVLFSIKMDGNTLKFAIKNYSTSANANVIPNFYILRIKSV
jgi:hypothetical protein